ncbi:hypothetical protein D3C86_1505350 [compost metagenome]
MGEARHQRQRVAHLAQNIGIGPFQGGDALFQAGGKIEFTAHRAFGYFRHHLTAAGQFSEFIDALDLDGGRIHVHHQQPRGFQMWDFPQRRHIQPGVMRQTSGARRQ